VTSRRAGVLAAIAIGSTLAGAPRRCAAETKIQLLVIGNNEGFSAPADATTDRPQLPPLQFADDDAAAFYELMSAIADSGHLLTKMDRETEAAYPRLAPIAQAPTLPNLRAALAALSRRMLENRRGGNDNTLYVFFSGHGSLDEEGKSQLALLDGGISQQLLYDEVLAALPAEHVHLLVDACHAEAVVRPRDANAREVRVAPDDARSFLARSTLARFPHVGAIVAATAQAPAHEWDLLRHGVFTYELLSALRGAADVNRDGLIEYSEAYAFLRAANRAIENPQARLALVVHAPEINRRAPLLDLSRFQGSGVGHLGAVPGSAGLIEVEDAIGRLLVSLRGERGYLADLLIPAGVTIYVRADDREARFQSLPGRTTPFADLSFQPRRDRPRGALEDALRRGLFSSEFGRGYYTGLVDQGGDFVPVSFPPGLVVRAPTQAPQPRVDADAGARPAAWSLFLGVGGSSSVARELDAAGSGRIGVRPRARAGAMGSIDLARAAGPGLTEWQLTASAGWDWPGSWGPVRWWWGAAAGGGAIGQTLAAGPSRWSGVATGGPALGLGANVTRRIGIWGEAQLFGLVYRRDDRVVASPAPSAWIGVTFGR
jgi:hypothetical protein